MDGKNTFVYGRHLFSEGLLDEADLALKPCRVEFWGGCAFINLDDNAPPLRECIGPLAERLDQHQVDKLRSEWWYATVLPANWKIAMEAFMEGYHVMRTHPQLQAAAPALYNAIYANDTAGNAQPVDPKATARETIMAQFRHMELLSEGMAGMCPRQGRRHPPPGCWMSSCPRSRSQAIDDLVRHASTTRSPRTVAPAASRSPDLNALAVTHPVKAVEFIFPHYFLLPFLSSMASYRIRPLGPESCLFEIWSLTLFPEGEEPAPPREPVVLPHDSDKFPPIPRQDYSNIPRQQIGLHAGGFEFMRLSKDVEGLISNYQRVIDGYLAGAAADELGRATAALAGGFDGPIIAA